MVGSFQGVYSEQIRIVGEAARPQSVAFRQNMSLLDVMIQSGGLTDFADGNAAVLLVTARLRYIAGTRWGTKMYMDMKRLRRMKEVAA